jgi:opacity protein-like surface antigen
MMNFKKSIVTIAVIAMLSSFFVVLGASDANARAIGIKGGWAMVRDDYESADFQDTFTYGLYFDMGRFIFNSLSFRPGLDYIKLEQEDNSGNVIQELIIWGIHLDWYWHFMGKSSISPFLGFGAAMNILDDDDDQTDDDSDAGLEVFGGADIGLTGSISLLLEARYCVNDIANRGQNMLKALVGLSFKF